MWQYNEDWLVNNGLAFGAIVFQELRPVYPAAMLKAERTMGARELLVTKRQAVVGLFQFVFS